MSLAISDDGWMVELEIPKGKRKRPPFYLLVPSFDCEVKEVCTELQGLLQRTLPEPEFSCVISKVARLIWSGKAWPVPQIATPMHSGRGRPCQN